MKELDEQEKMGWTTPDGQLLDRIAKVGQDPFVVFQMTWGTEENTTRDDVFGVAIVGQGHTIALDGPRIDWRLILVKALDLWDGINAKAGE